MAYERFTNPNITCYADAEALFKTCRFPAKGKPMRQRGFRLCKQGGEYTITYTKAGTVLCRITRKNTIVFEMPLDTLWHNSTSIVAVVHNIVPLAIARQKKGVYRIGSTVKVSEMNRKRDGEEFSSWDGWRWLEKEAPQYFKALAFDLATGECLNAQPDTVYTPKPDARKQWLRDLKRYKQGLKARVKVGALQGYITERNEGGRGNTNAFRWEAAVHRKLLIRCMKNETYPPEILKAFVMSVHTGWVARAITQGDVLAEIDYVFNKNSFLFRKGYGVFGKTLHEKS